MNKRGFTVVELMTTFALVSVIAILLINLTLTLKEIYINGDMKTALLTKQGNMTDKIYKDLKEDKLISLTSCGTNCVNFEYETGTKVLKIDKEKKILSYNNYAIKLGDGGYFGTVEISNFESDIGNILNLNIPIHHRIVKGNFGINITHQLENLNYDDSINFDVVTDKEILYTDDAIYTKAKSLVYKDGSCKTDGTTYSYMGGCYIKGASTNNYIWYNGFMWRIMGINSDDTVRMIVDENVTALPYGTSGTAEKYEENKDYIHDWLNAYFLGNLNNENNIKSIIKKGEYFCNETTNSIELSEETVLQRKNCDNKKIEAKVGIISYDEYYLAGQSSSYLNIGQGFRTMTPYNISNAWYVNNNGDITGSTLTFAGGIRPIINVKPNSTITKGNGTTSSYYVLIEDKNSHKIGTIGENATSGEYVKFEEKTYRIVSKENNGIKLILDGYYDTFVAFGTNDNTFTTSSGIGATLNKEVLTWIGDSNKIKETTWYQGTTISVGYTYKQPLADDNIVDNGNKFKVGLIRIGEILSGQSSTISSKKTYWTMNKATNTSNALYVRNVGSANDISVTNTYGIRPVIVVDSTLTINGGNGTPNSPYEI